MRDELAALARPVADTVARRLVASGRHLDDDPELSYQHAVAARRLASRIAVVREAVGLAAYKSGEWQTAVGELRAYHRMTGKQTHLAILADCERALGRPERAVDLYRSAQRQAGDTAEAIELLIVAAGARADMGQKDAAVAMLQVRELTADEPWVSRLRYAYADALLGVGRDVEAREWFARAAEADLEGETDAAERLLELDGITLEEDDEEDLESDGIEDGGVEGARAGSDDAEGGRAEDAAVEGEVDAGDTDPDWQPGQGRRVADRSLEADPASGDGRDADLDGDPGNDDLDDDFDDDDFDDDFADDEDLDDDDDDLDGEDDDLDGESAAGASLADDDWELRQPPTLKPASGPSPAEPAPAESAPAGPLLTASPQAGSPACEPSTGASTPEQAEPPQPDAPPSAGPEARQA